MTPDSALPAGEPFVLPPGLATTLVLVRHGESTYIAEGRFQGRHDPALSPAGERTARLVAERLADSARPPSLPVPAGAPAGVWHSPLARARQTAEAIAHAHPAQPPLRPDAGLIEIGQGDWEGRTHDEVRRMSPEALAGWRHDPLRSNAPGGERLLDAASRVRVALARVVAVLAAERSSTDDSPVPGYAPSTASHPWGIVVAHDGIFRLALLTLLGVPLERFWSFPFVLCAITVVDLRDGRGSLVAHNLADHLAPVAAAAVAETEARECAGAL